MSKNASSWTSMLLFLSSGRGRRLADEPWSASTRRVVTPSMLKCRLKCCSISPADRASPASRR